MVNHELTLPCPFCGSEDIHMTLVEDHSDGWTSQAQIFCNKCGATHSLDWDLTKNFSQGLTAEMKAQLIEKWNNRVSTSAGKEDK